MKIFVDTNIFLDLILKRENFDKSLLIFNAVEFLRFSLYLKLDFEILCVIILSLMLSLSMAFLGFKLKKVNN